jgi:tetratricopeptide (TPR) repeat protein
MALRFKRAFAAVHSRVDHFNRTQDPTRVLDPKALEDAAKMWRTATTADDKLAARHLLGWLHGARFVSQQGEGSFPDLIQALLLFLPFTQTVPETIPETFNHLIGPDGDPAAQAAVAKGLLARCMQYTDPAAPIVAIELLTRALHAIPPEEDDERLALLKGATELRRAWDDTGVRTVTVEHLFVIDRSDMKDVARDLDAAIAQVSQPDEPGVAHMRAYQDEGIAADLGAAIQLFTKAVARHRDRATALAELGLAYEARYDRVGDPADIEQAVEKYRESLAETSEIDAAQYDRIRYLTGACRERFTATGKRIDRAELAQLAERARGMMSSPPKAHLQAMAMVALLAQAMGAHKLAAESFRDAVQALPRVARWEVAWTDRERSAGDFTGMVGEAVAAHLNIQDPKAAWEIAEQGRSVLLSAQLDLRTDLTELRRIRPDLAERFENLQNDLDTGADVPARTRDQVTAAQGWTQDFNWHKVLADIRGLDGFEKFLTPLDWADLTQAAEGGAVVLVNAAAHRSDAILLRPGHAEPTVVNLDQLTLDDARRHADNPLASVPELLKWLGDTVIEPVLDALDGTERVWWLPIGPLGLLPLHAAGPALDRVVSSYTPTVRALLRARRRPAGRQRPLAVAMSRTPGHADLPGAIAEADALPGAVRITNHEATADRVLAAMQEAEWVHFACHAGGDAVGAGLLLHDGPLSLVDIARADLNGAELAYLSACSTARTATRSPDEAVHLASAFQLAGYRHVIGALWPLQDTVATLAARRFYELLGTADTSAAALHQLTCELREEYPPETWAALIHSGP